MALIVFGGSGFVGNSIIEVQKKYENIISFSSNKIEIYQQKKKTKISYKKVLEFLKKSKKVDAIFCAATRYDPNKYKDQPLTVFQNNINAILKFIKILDAKKMNKIIFVSSYAVYGQKFQNKNKEDFILSPDNFSKKEFYYALAKYTQEKIIINYCNNKNIKFNILRLPSIYGPGSTLDQKKAHVIPSFILQILKKIKKINVFGTGNEKREFLYILDLIKIINKLRKKNINGILNVGSNHFISIKNLLNLVIKITNSQIEIAFNKKSISDVPLRKVSYNKFNNIFKKYKFTNINIGLERTINWYKKND